MLGKQWLRCIDPNVLRVTDVAVEDDPGVTPGLTDVWQGDSLLILRVVLTPKL